MVRRYVVNHWQPLGSRLGLIIVIVLFAVLATWLSDWLWPATGP